MTFGVRRAPLLLFIGDVAAFVLALWMTLLIRYLALPSAGLFESLFIPFLPLFAFWVLVFYMSGLYGKRIVLLQSNLLNAIFKTQLFNIVCAGLFFFAFPQLGIAPKTTLFIYFLVSFACIALWRLAIIPAATKPGMREKAALIGTGPEAEELLREVNGNPRYHLEFLSIIDPHKGAFMPGSLEKELSGKRISTLVIDSEHDAVRPYLPELYDLAFVQKRFQFADFYQVYEEVFDRVPLSLLRYDWFLKNVTHPTFGIYAFLKRLIDILGGIAMGVIAVIAAPLVWMAMRLEGPGPLFLVQERIGQYGGRIRSYKFRSMRTNKSASSQWTVEEQASNPVTRVGHFLRLTSLDEFPQFLNVLSGELSLIGPRNDIEGLGRRLAEAIPYYHVRYVVKPGITGWAQINQQYEQGNISPQSIEETKMRLAYDFYYIKNRSLMLDLIIALRTFKRMLFRLSSW